MKESEVEKRKLFINVDIDREIRCPYCNRLLMKGVIDAIETKCPKCKRVQRFKQLTNQ